MGGKGETTIAREASPTLALLLEPPLSPTSKASKAGRERRRGTVDGDKIQKRVEWKETKTVLQQYEHQTTMLTE